MLFKDKVIQVKNVSKNFALYEDPKDRLKQMIFPRLQKLIGLKEKKYYENFNALNDINFEITKGECIGIVGRNGSGKSTLLQIICSTLLSSSGDIITKGRIAPLLELGMGFNPEFSGKDNIYLNGSILGLSNNEIVERYDEICKFADIGNFINYPVKTYSSGMYVRLAFAIAINVSPDILIIDEALAVGDEAFQRKCYAKIEQIKLKGTTIIFVSHSAQTIISICSRAILLDAGEVIMNGNPSDVIKNYQKLVSVDQINQNIIRNKIKKLEIPEIKENNNDESKSKKIQNELITDDSWYDENLKSNYEVKYESSAAKISDVKIINGVGKQVNNLRKGYYYYISYKVSFHEQAESVGFGMLIKTMQGVELGGASSFNDMSNRVINIGTNEIYNVKIMFKCNFLSNTFVFNVGVLSIKEGNEFYNNRILDAGLFRVMSEKTSYATSLIDFDVTIQFDKE
tara:strand:- start:74 stop:1444 length:1371 start_codon:yes stop_codon:yes gene_type:complete